MKSVIVALSFSAGLGIFFGFYPHEDLLYQILSIPYNMSKQQ
jgi:hypothetical protein